MVHIQCESLDLQAKSAIQLLFASKGSGNVNGQGLREQSALQLDPGESAHLGAGQEGVEILHFTLPLLAM
jgi:hypothetical protein